MLAVVLNYEFMGKNLSWPRFLIIWRHMNCDKLRTCLITVKGFLVDTATGTQITDEREQTYSNERKRLLLAMRSTDMKPPTIVTNYQSLRSFWGFIKLEYSHYDKRRKYINEQFLPLEKRIEEEELFGGETLLGIEAENAYAVQTGKIIRHIENGDYDSAITSSRTLVQSVEEDLLRRLTGETVAKDDADALHSKTMKALNLDPSKDYDKRLKMIISGLNSVNSGIAQVRNVAGNAHSPKYKAEKHHAALAYNSAVTLCQFLLDTEKYQASQKS